MDSLVALGVDAARVTAAGMGEDFPIASNETEEGRSQNRRVDVILLDD
jgi:outer membrane protein OmpA-like peptidoglycan-associated protein